MKLLHDWSGLPPELLEQIAKGLPLLEDFTAFRGVCTTWRGAVSRNKYQFKVPLLMLAEKHRSHKCKIYMHNLDRLYRILMKNRCIRKFKIHRLCRRNKKQHNHEREFCSLSKRKICARLPFPDAKNKRCIDVGFGWMLAISASKCSKLRSGDTKYGKRYIGRSDTKYGKLGLGDISDGNVSLVKPFYPSPRIKLPNLTKFDTYKESGRWPDFAFFRRAMLLANPSDTSDFILLLVTDTAMVFWRNGDKKWTVLNPNNRAYFYDVVCYKGRIYAMEGCGRILIWDPNGNDFTKVIVPQMDNYPDVLRHNVVPYLVESTEGELLVILRNYLQNQRSYSYWHLSYETNYFRVMRVDIEAQKFEEIESVGRDAIFVGNNTPVALAADDYPGVLEPNCIYFTDDFSEGYFGEPEYRKGGGKDMGIYSFENKRIKRFGIKSFSPIGPPMWVFPSF